MKSSICLTFLVLVLAVVCALALHAWGLDLSPADPVVQAAVFSCFCMQLKAERQAEAEKTGVPSTVWPLPDPVQRCIQTTLHADRDSAQAVWLQVRERGRLSHGEDGVTACSAGGYDVAQTTPEPASAEVMSVARKIYCKMITSGSEHVPSEAQMQRALTVPYHISKKLAGAALDRAALENTAGMYACK